MAGCPLTHRLADKKPLHGVRVGKPGLDDRFACTRRWREGNKALSTGGHMCAFNGSQHPRFSRSRVSDENTHEVAAAQKLFRRDSLPRSQRPRKLRSTAKREPSVATLTNAFHRRMFFAPNRPKADFAVPSN